MLPRAQIPKIFPKPRSLVLHGGFFCGDAQADCSLDSSLPAQAFSLTIEHAGGVRIVAADRAGTRYAQNVLAQIQAQATPQGLPCLTLEDAPDFPVRGFMLDISRGRVPEMTALFRLVDLLANLRYNQLQLYIEHTFAFKHHEAVWRDASPMTAAEIRELDAYCAAHGVELVPNLNSFGHVERWLKHSQYKALAECPDGFFHALFKQQRAAGTFRACEETADFMGALYEEFLPNFSSKIFNIGGDEPWELGEGRSREACEKHGKKAVYFEHMARLQARAGACGKRIQFWADVLLENAENAPAKRAGDKTAVPLADAIPMIWGYERGHSFDAQCAHVATQCKEFYVVPGTSAWLSLTGRLDNALANISEAVAAGTRHGARGILLTTWGDFGYHNPFCANLLPLLACAAQSWNFMGNQSPDLLGGFESFLGTRELATALFYAGRLDNFFAKKITNRSVLRELFFAKHDALAQLLNGISKQEIVAAKKEIERLQSAENLGESVSAQELSLALAMSHVACRRAGAFLSQDNNALAEIEKEISGTLAEKFAYLWRLRNRAGGLSESLKAFSLKS